MKFDYDVVIIGGAFFGAATALMLKRRRPDARVLIIEKGAAFVYDGFVPDTRLRKQIFRGVRRWCKCEQINLGLMLRRPRAAVTGVGLSAVASTKADAPGNVSRATVSNGAGSSALS
jgi:choline dehydrogenase-like flavoprotein